MGIEDEKPGEKEHEELTVDLSRQKLKKLERPTSEQQLATTLIADDNELQKLDNLDLYPNLKKLSAANNVIFRMFWVCNLINLEELNLSNNSIVTIEGLRDLKFLKYLNLSKNKIKSIDNLTGQIFLEKIDLSDNNLIHISDLSNIQHLKELYLHCNSISHLKQCEKNLPKSLEILTLHNNLIHDLNEISHLVNLLYLKKLSIANNPCVEFPENQKFNYRPFIKNWCSGMTIIDDRLLNDIECLKAEWLYSQGRGRSFRPGEHAALIEYLHSVCPREGEEENMENEEVKKLKLILSKAQQHQKQLREQLSTGHIPVRDPSKFVIARKKPALASERMVSSFHEHPQKDHKNSQELMSRSLDSEIFKTSTFRSHRTETKPTPLETSTTFIPLPDTLISPDVGPTIVPRPASISSRTSRSSSRDSSHSTPESKRKVPRYLIRQCDNASPLNFHKLGSIGSRGSTPISSLRSRNTPSPAGKGTSIRESGKYLKETSEDEDSETIALKVMAVQQRANQRKKLVLGEAKRRNIGKTLDSEVTNTAEWKAATCIQRRWRGYRARNLNKDVLAACSNIQMNRMQDYITKVMADMEVTRNALEKNRKLLLFHMQAIHGLWKKMTSIQPAVNGKENEEKVSLQGLADTCANLNKQVESLQMLVKTMQTSKASSNPIATQTEIVAVQTPEGDPTEIFFAKAKDTEPSLKSCSLFGEEECTKKIQDTDELTVSGVGTQEEPVTGDFKASIPSPEPPEEKFNVVVLRKPSVKLHEAEVPVPKEPEAVPSDREVQGPGNS